jgi:hypothetical protein
MPELAPLAKTTVRLNPRPGSAAQGASKIGGLFLWPKDEEWPRCEEHNSAYVAAMQLRKEDFPEVEFRRETDLMQVLWCPNNHQPGYCPDVRVFWRQTGAVADPVEVHPDPTLVGDEYLEYKPSPCRFYPERIIEYPDSFGRLPCGWENRFGDLPEVAAALDCNKRHAVGHWSDSGNATILYQWALSTAEGTKLGGHPGWVQAPWYPTCSCGAAMEYLATFSSWEFDGGTWFRWLPIEERDILRAEQKLMETVNSPTNCMFGDAGEMYVFICRKCPDWPTVAGMQCS